MIHHLTLLGLQIACVSSTLITNLNIHCSIQPLADPYPFCPGGSENPNVAWFNTIVTNATSAIPLLDIGYHYINHPTHVNDLNGTSLWCGNPMCNDLCVNTACKPAVGELHYCEHYACDNSSPCTCRLVHWDSFLHNAYHGINNSMTYSTVHGMHMTPWELRELISSSVCSSKVKEGVLRVACTEDVIVVVQKDSFTKLYETENKILAEKLPDFIGLKTGYLSLTIYNEAGEVIGYDSISITGEKVCKVSDCWFCIAALNSFECQPLTYSVGVWVTFIVLILVLYFCLRATVPYCIRDGTVLWACIKALMPCCLCTYTYRVFKDRWELARKERESKGYNAPRSSYEEKMPNGQMDTSKIFLFSLFLFFISTPSVRACEGGATVSAQTRECVNDGQIETCEYILDSLISLPYTGSEACLTLLNDEEHPVGVVKIKYDAHQIVMLLESQYHTSNWHARDWSHKECYNDNHCANRCTVDPNDPTAHGELSDTAFTTYPGKSGCSRVDGGIFHDCGFPQDACLWYRWVIKPMVPYSEIFITGDKKDKIYIDVSIEHYNGTTEFIVYDHLQQNVPLNLDNMNFEIVSVSEESDIVVNKKIRKTDDLWDLVDAADRNMPVRGVPGDIQAESRSAFENSAGRLAIEFDPTLVTLTHTQDTSHITSRVPGNQLQGIELPGLYQGRLWSIVDNSLQANLSDSSPVIINFKTDAGFKLSRSVNVVCPDFKVLNVTGCYSCSIGFLIMIEASSECLAGGARTSISDSATLTTSSVYLETMDTEIEVHGNSDSSDFHSEFCLFSGSKKHCEDVEFHLSFDSDISNLGSEATKTEESKHRTTTPWSFIKGLFDKVYFKNPLNIFLSSLVIFAMLAFIILGTGPCLRLLRKRD